MILSLPPFAKHTMWSNRSSFHGAFLWRSFSFSSMVFSAFLILVCHEDKIWVHGDDFHKVAEQMDKMIDGLEKAFANYESFGKKRDEWCVDNLAQVESRIFHAKQDHETIEIRLDEAGANNAVALNAINKLGAVTSGIDKEQKRNLQAQDEAQIEFKSEQRKIQEVLSAVVDEISSQFRSKNYEGKSILIAKLREQEKNLEQQLQWSREDLKQREAGLRQFFNEKKSYQDSKKNELLDALSVSAMVESDLASFREERNLEVRQNSDASKVKDALMSFCEVKEEKLIDKLNGIFFDARVEIKNAANALRETQTLLLDVDELAVSPQQGVKNPKKSTLSFLQIKSHSMDDPFEFVRQTIIDSLVKLKEAANKDVSEKDWCDQEERNVKQQRQKLDEQIAKAKAQIIRHNKEIDNYTKEQQLSAEFQAELANFNQSLQGIYGSGVKAAKEIEDIEEVAFRILEKSKNIIKGKAPTAAKSLGNAQELLQKLATMVHDTEIHLEDNFALVNDAVNCEGETAQIQAEFADDALVQAEKELSDSERIVRLRSNDLKNLENTVESINLRCGAQKIDPEEMARRREEEIQSLRDALKVLQGEM